MGQFIEIPYQQTSVRACEARPAGAGPFPALVVIQEWWGLDEHITPSWPDD